MQSKALAQNAETCSCHTNTVTYNCDLDLSQSLRQHHEERTTWQMLPSLWSAMSSLHS